MECTIVANDTARNATRWREPDYLELAQKRIYARDYTRARRQADPAWYEQKKMYVLDYGRQQRRDPLYREQAALTRKLYREQNPQLKERERELYSIRMQDPVAREKLRRYHAARRTNPVIRERERELRELRLRDPLYREQLRQKQQVLRVKIMSDPELRARQNAYARKRRNQHRDAINARRLELASRPEARAKTNATAKRLREKKRAIILALRELGWLDGYELRLPA